MSDQNLFAEDWIDCLRAHYAHVIHEQDTNNEKSLVSVLLQSGFTEEDIVSMHSDALGGIEQPEEIAQAELTDLPEESYDWVIPQEPQITPVEADAYQWVVEAQPEEAPIELAETAEAPVDSSEVAIEPEPQSDSAVEAELPLDSEDAEPPDSFVQMSLF